MHMADALLSPAVGGSLWAVSAAAIAYGSKKVRTELDDDKAPLMGVLGAFLFAAQMINFTIPATGSSGHLGGGLLLAILLGPHAAFLTMASVLVVQALFFADGGLLALGCNIFNMGFIPACIVYPLVYRQLVGTNPSRARLTTAIVVSAVIGLQLGPLAVALETVLSGISALPFSTFALLMQPVHLAIGIVEGLVTAAIISLVYKARPEILARDRETRPSGSIPLRSITLAFLAAALITGGIISRFASKNPDGLEWAIKRSTGATELEAMKAGIHGALASLQERTAFLPDYTFRKPDGESKGGAAPMVERTKPGETGRNAAGNKLGTSVSGLIGGGITLGLALMCGFLLRKKAQPAA